MSLPRKRYTWRLAGAMTAFVVTFAMAEYWIDHRQAHGAVAAGLALLPGLCIAAVFWALGRLLVEEQDEYRRMLLTREVLIGTGITMTAITVWGFLAEYRIVPPGHAFYAVWLFFFAQGIGGIVNRLTYGDSGSC
jgi:hypothetical protein